VRREKPDSSEALRLGGNQEQGRAVCLVGVTPYRWRHAVGGEAVRAHVADADAGGSRPPRAAIAVFLSALVPGLGHAYAGRIRRALLFGLPILIAVVAVAVVATRGRVRLVELLVQPRVLWVLIALNLALLAWRLFAVVDILRITGGGVRWPGVLTAGFTFVVVLFVAAPHVVITSYGVTSIDLLETVFVADEPRAASDADVSRPPRFQGEAEGEELPDPALTRVIVPPEPRSYRNLIFREGIGDPEAVAVWPDLVGGPAVAPAFPAEDVDDVDRISILLAGGDGGPGRGGTRTDTIIVATFDTTTGKASLFSVPRNLAQFPLPEIIENGFVEYEERLAPYVYRRDWVDLDGDGVTEPPPFVSCKCFPDQINAMYPWSRTWTETYPDEVEPGMAALRDSLELMLGLHIDYYALVRMSGFVRLVNALGGVRTHVLGSVVTEVSPYVEGGDWISVELRSGWQRLNGEQALAYVRDRKSVSDYTRTKRQRCLLRSVAASADPVTVLTRFNRIADAVKGSVKTDIPLSFLPTLVSLGAELEFTDIATVGFVPPYFAPEVDHRNHPIPDQGRIQAMVQWALNADVTTEFVSGGESECRT